jgi:CO/xanthine dehydrogenase Mo-binding subunit
MAQSTESPAVGSSVPRVDGVAKVAGTALYVDDSHVPGAFHGATVRSQVAHGTLKSIDLDPDFDWKDIVVATAEDIPGRNTVLLIEEDQPLLVPVGGRVSHVDEPVALVAAPTRRRAHEAAEHVKLTIEEKPAVLSIDEAIDGNTKLYGSDNVFKEFLIEKGNPKIHEAMAEAFVIIEGVYATHAQEQMYIEPQGMIADWPGDGSVRITGSLQCPYYVHKAMKELLALDGDKTIISQSVTGGGFGGKEEYPSMIAGHAAVLAKKAGKPVKLIYDREEDIAATTKRHPAVVRHRLGLKEDGTIVAIDVDVVIDGGAYLTLSPVVLSRAVLHAAGPYNCKNTRIRGRAVATNHPPHGAFRGFGAPQTTFAYERQMNRAARHLRIDPFELRRMNMLRKGDKTATSQTLTHSVGSEKVFADITKVAEENALGPRVEPASGTRGAIRRGRGLAFYFHGSGFTGSGEQRLAGRATIAVCEGGKIEVRSSSTDIGQGAITMFSQIAATALGLDVDRIDVVVPSTDVVPDSGPTVASRTCMVVGGLVDRGSQAIKARLESWAKENDMASSPLEDIAKAIYEAEGEVSETVQYSPPPGIEWDDETYTGSAYPVYGWAACLVDVAVDLDTCEVTIELCAHSVDVGKAINPVIVKGQIEGGTLQALGWALWEDVRYENGRVMNRRMTNCIVPTFADAPEMQTFLVEEPYPFGPHGAKGVGEIPMDGPAAAVANAIEDALGIPFNRLPLLPETIQDAVRLLHPDESTEGAA